MSGRRFAVNELNVGKIGTDGYCRVMKSPIGGNSQRRLLKNQRKDKKDGSVRDFEAIWRVYSL